MAKFTALVALLAIFVDAAIGHGLLWENDPYWSYWVTKTALIATIFGLGTAWFGIGAGRGAAITAVHSLVLTVYYWSLAPIGLPSHPEWLDLEHTWGTGVPVHFGVIYLGYLGALWLWRRRERTRAEGVARGPSAVTRDATQALGVGLLIVVLAGGLISLATGQFPGVQWFLVRLLITVPFLLGWWAYAGRDRGAALGGAIVLSFIWVTYSHFVGPSGLPDLPLRILDQAPPGATAYWDGYKHLFLISLPIALAVSGALLLAVARFEEGSSGDGLPVGMTAVGAAGAALVLVLGAVAYAGIPNEGDRASISASGPARVEVGNWYSDAFGEGRAQLELTAVERNPRVTPLPPHDRLSIDASVQHPGGRTFEITVRRPMVEDPMGEHGTWWGVGLHRWHHGDSGIGTRKLPPIHSEVAVFGIGTVRADGRVIATGVPVHVMTAERGLPGRLELDVGRDAAGSEIPGLPDGHLRVVWDDYRGGDEQTGKRLRNLLGSAVLVFLLGLTLLAVRRGETVPG